jgi:hypothetical protein
MGSLPVLEVAIGLCFVYLLLSLIVTTLTEWVSRIRGGRGRILEAGLRRLVGDDERDSGFTRELLQHPLIRTTSKEGKRPSYISAQVFARVLSDVVQQRRLRPQSAATAPAASAPDIPATLNRSLIALRGTVGTRGVVPGDDSLPDPEVLERWFDQHMDRVSGWYKRHTQTIALITAVGLTFAANADSVSLAKRLWSDSALRSTVVDAAKSRIAMGPPLETVEYTDPTTPKPSQPITPSDPSGAGAGPGSANQLSPDEQALLGSMMGWSGERLKLRSQGWLLWLLFHVPGWIITALAVSMGAPFWFDTLNRFINIRSAGPPPQSTADPKVR